MCATSNVRADSCRLLANPSPKPMPRLLSIVIVSCLLASHARAQPVLDLKPSCTQCRVVLSLVVEIQSVWSDGGLSGRPTSIGRIARSQWAVVDADGSRVYRFDSSGRYVGELGRAGSGPGEFADATFVLDWGGDSTAIFDARNSRTHIYAASGRLARTQRWDGLSIWFAMRTPEGGFVTSGSYGSRSSFGLPLHQFSREGRLQRSFGARSDIRVTRPGSVPRYQLPPRTERDGAFWAVQSNAPVLHHFQLGGLPTDEWRLPIAEFPMIGMNPDGSAKGAQFFTIDPLENGLLLVGVAYADPRSAEGLGARLQVDGQQTRRVDDWGRFLNTRLMVLDPTRREVLSITDEDTWIAGSLGGGLLWGIRPGGDGGRVVVVRATFQR